MQMRMILCAGLFISLVMAGSAHAKPENYKIDPVHSSVVFKVSHLGFSNIYGMFSNVSGSFVVDKDKPSNNKIDLVIQADSIETFNEDRDKHLKGPDFFNVKQYPEITFKTTQVEKLKNGLLKVTGSLNMHGKTKTVTFDLSPNRSGKDLKGVERTGADATFSLKRSDFGIDYMLKGENSIGDDIQVMVSIEGIKQG